jgi:tRNA nucleotidyltransferase (CCA-adding enzyme)
MVLGLRDLAVNGETIMAELGLPESPQVGAILDGLLERAIADPSLNTPERLLALARSLAADPVEEQARAEEPG